MSFEFYKKSKTYLNPVRNITALHMMHILSVLNNLHFYLMKSAKITRSMNIQCCWHILQDLLLESLAWPAAREKAMRLCREYAFIIVSFGSCCLCPIDSLPGHSCFPTAASAEGFYYWKAVTLQHYWRNTM